MAKRIYLQSAIAWAISIGLIITGTPVFLYFIYSNEIGAITITSKSWTSFCNATSWTEIEICEAYFNFTANEDVFWYPTDYDPYGRDTPYNFDPSVKEWVFERKWGDGWRKIDLTKPCTGTWCGGKKDRSMNVYSVAWRNNKSYETRIRAIKQNKNDNIVWSFGDEPIWYGIKVTYEQECYKNKEIKEGRQEIVQQLNSTQTKCKDEPLNLTCSEDIVQSNYSSYSSYNEVINTTLCKDVAAELDGEYGKVKFDYGNYNCKLDKFNFICDNKDDGNGDGICDSGESCINISIVNLRYISKLDVKSFKEIQIK